jgi:hypothetical protein
LERLWLWLSLATDPPHTLALRARICEGLTGRSQRVSTARAVEDSEITRVDKRTMVRMLREEPNFSERFTAHLWGIGPTGFAQIAVAAA